MEVIPISAPDSISVFRNMRVRTFFVVDDRLDEAKLREALTRLIRDHWRKLGARIITHKNKGAVYHLPKVFDDGYELFRWSANHSDSLLDDAAAQINFKTARLDGGVAVFPSVDVCDALFRPQQWPFTFDAEPDAPMLLIHLSLFSDATVIAISHPHMLGDQLGLANIIKAWLGLLEDRIPPPMLGHNDDILPGQKPFSQYPKSETFKKGQYHVRRPFERVGVLLPFIWELTTEPKEEKATLFFPAPLIQSLRERHTGILAEKRGTSLELTNGDFVSAILLKLARLSSEKKPNLSFSQTINVRGRIPALSTPESQAGYIHNGLVYSTSRFRYDHSMALSEIARLQRAGIAKVAGDPAAIDIGCAVTREQHRRGQPLHICEPFDRSYHVTNWAPAWRGLNFGPALEKEVKGGREGRSVSFVVLGDGHLPGAVARYSSFICSKSEDGYWVNFSASTRSMKAVKKYLMEDPMLEHL